MRPHFLHFVRACVRWVWVPIVAFVLVVAVAMVCAVWSPVHYRGTWSRHDEPKDVSVPLALRRYDTEYSFGVGSTGFGVTFFYISTEFLRGDVMPYTAPPSYSFSFVRAGFPFRCLRWVHGLRVPPSESSPWARGIETKRKTSGMKIIRRIPLMPEPVGMVLNVLIVSAAIVLPRMAWRSVVVFRRRTKGLCVKCAYPIEPSAPRCPECGSAYPVSAVPSRA